jgi:hypothetical protein
MSEPAAPLPSEVRASDAEREAVVRRLRDHAAEGRLDPDELADRVERAYAATTRAELSVLTRDLPAPAPGASPTPLRRRAADVLRGDVGSFVLVNVLLIVIWAASGGGYFWPIWPLLGWGLGLVTCGTGHGRKAPGHRGAACAGRRSTV